MVTAAPPSGAKLRSSTRPRTTAARTGLIAPAVTPVWIGVAPAYRKLVALPMVVTSARFTTLATITGSGGRLDVRRVTVMLMVALLPAASVAAYVIVFASVTVPLVVTDAALMMSPSAGCVTALAGAWVSSVTMRTTVAVLVAASCAVTVSGFAPSASGAWPVNTPAPSTGHGTPFTSTVTGVASVTASAGGCVSSVTARVSVVAFPAASVATVVRVFAPSVSVTDPLKWRSAPTVSGVPFTATVTADASVTDPDTVTEV